MPASSSTTFDFFDATAAQEWPHAPLQPHPYASASAHPSPSPLPQASESANQHQVPHLSVQPHVALCAASPQSMVSSSSPAGPADTPSSAGHPGKKRSIDRNRKPCGRCSASKRKCKPIEGSLNLCERCKSQGFSECAPYKSWTDRKASLGGEGSLSPLDKDNLSSRSTSPSYVGAGSPPVGYPSPYQNEHEVHPGSATTQEWVQTQSAASGVDMVSYDNFYANQNQNIAAPLYPQQDVQNASGYAQPIKLCCHACNAPYREDHEFLINYALAMLARSAPTEPYEPDQSMLGAYGHVQTSNSDPSFQNPYN